MILQKTTGQLWAAKFEIQKTGYLAVAPQIEHNFYFAKVEIFSDEDLKFEKKNYWHLKGFYGPNLLSTLEEKNLFTARKSLRKNFIFFSSEKKKHFHKWEKFWGFSHKKKPPA